MLLRFNLYSKYILVFMLCQQKGGVYIELLRTIVLPSTLEL